ncbi:MAG: vitamin B12 dependent-methionine synthase activation domain-containing protein [Lachnospiraceae bacterium]|nr:vitamin B12 dependent-methionine synthase activation domain-containing protein [Lachnospiraceae bacterium]
MQVNRHEIYRYLGVRGEIDEASRLLVEECLAELRERVTPRHIMRDFPLSIGEDGVIDFTCFQTRSENLRKNLKGCSQIRIFAATLGEGADFLIRRYERVRISKSVVMQAASAAMIEAYCNELNQKWREEAALENRFLRPRFSPGYGDFPLEIQTMICDVLKTEKTVGITLTDALLMMPSKSVTAVIGMSDTRTDCEPEGCEICAKTNCIYRRC